MKIMAQSFCFGTENHTNGALDPPLLQHTNLTGASQIDPKTRQSGLVKQFLVTTSQRGPDVFAFCRRTPIRGCGHGTTIRAEADQYGFVAETFPHELADVHFTVMTHLCRARVSEMRIVRPNNCFRLLASIEMRNQIFDCLDHVPVAQIPR